MNYQNLLCLGDSLTFGARSYGCYPLYLAKFLSNESPYLWRTINRSANGYRARDLWFLVNQEIDGIHDTYQACLMIGTNDVGHQTPLSLFGEYYRQILQTLFIKGFKVVFCGEIPPIFPDGHVFFPNQSTALHKEYNSIVENIVNEYEKASLVRFTGLTRRDYEDPVHFNESGNQKVAETFSKVILQR